MTTEMAIGTIEEAQIVVTNNMNTLDDYIRALNEEKSFYVTITVSKNGQLKHNVLTLNFPKEDLLRSHSAIKKILIEQLES